MRYHKAWAKSIENDLEGLAEEEFDQLDQSFEEILESPNSKTKRLKNWKGNIRRLRFGNRRLLLYVSDRNITVYALALLPRKECYNKKNQRLIERLVQHMIR